MTRGSTLPPHRLSHPATRLPIPAQTRTSPPAPPEGAAEGALEGFNAAPADEAHHILLSRLRSIRWARRLADHRPYPTLDALLAASDEAAYDLTAGDLAEALAGETLPTLPDDTYEAAHMALGAAHAAYEARFGHVFVICVDGLAPNEVLDHLLAAIRSRLANDPEDERVVVAEELRRLARGRLVNLLRGAGL
ncbi:2-oxo-4-hydroxy-4-carboxy-5-ureidoimidazoline decarboxylase [Streptomyces sp. NBC_01275]|uniref:2-oxo-4-hydroxy-4-carboxy-5-ureidoimidazoline decarboxylase n=1 Tax=Streptomyces sp. NBC_01275 TaxID=2903807 RepID=UPI0022511318|nr:2-oxo-4-hydroxy-4-carboxy-5-ureidoimidazoline decarboxylase [Streptomyces sp. NBC_01275]MCX4764537.1 2-oxo-4-hydroxy-4-carboxy-5-ureidoimidazoline decarboxylase [Streptomyces sp. NBC_01275]